MNQRTPVDVDSLLSRLHYWDKIADCADQFIDLMLNYRQSGHPGGSRSKVHAFVATTLSGMMRWDVRRPEHRFGDRFILVAGHTVPLIYGTLPVFFEAMRARHERSGDDRFAIPDAQNRALYAEHLVGLRRRSGLPGHAESEGRTLFLKFNTGPSGHGSPVAAGQALALKRAGADGVRVFAFEGEGGLTTGVTHETLNAAWGLGLDNLFYVVDWNDFGIDPNQYSDFVPGTPAQWFGSRKWRVGEAGDGSDWRSILSAFEKVEAEGTGRPAAVIVKTRKGRGYLKYDYASHGKPHAMNSPTFWQTKRPFMEKYGVEFAGYDMPAPVDDADVRKQALHNLNVVADVIRQDNDLVDYLSDRLIDIAESVPETIATFRLGDGTFPLDDNAVPAPADLPRSLFKAPGTRAPNRAALAGFGAWLNASCREHYGRPLFIAMSADLAESTNISGFGDAHQYETEEGQSDGAAPKTPGYGWFERDENTEGVVLPQPITEFANAGICAGIASVNLARDPFAAYEGFLAACSTYGSFSYLKYGPMRLFSQLAQDAQIRCGRILWVAGHSGPETAEDSRTHFGVFAPGVTQLFPDGHVVDLHPWEYNEVPVVIAAALRSSFPIIALHLTRPEIPLPDREALAMPSYLEAARGAYMIRDYRDGEPKMGTVVVQGTSTTHNLVQVLGDIDREGINVKIVAAISPQLFARQDEAYRLSVLSPSDRLDAMVITNRSARLMSDWVDVATAREWSLSSDWDNRWRTGGTVDEVIDEAHLSPAHILEAIRRFAAARERRRRDLRNLVDDIAD